MNLPAIVAFDVDGTLVDHDGYMAPATHAALQQLRARDTIVVLATGRPFATAGPTLEQVGGVDWMVCGNGSYVFNVATGHAIRDSALPSEIVTPLVRGLRQAVPGVRVAIETTQALYDEPGFSDRVPEPMGGAIVDDALTLWEMNPAPVRRIIPFHDDYDDRLYELADITRRFVDDRCQVQAFGGLPIVDVSPAGDNKAVALGDLVAHLGLTAADVLAFGDGNNDVEMIRWAGTGVAMGNAVPALQQVADAVTSNIRDEGVMAYLAPRLER